MIFKKRAVDHFQDELFELLSEKDIRDVKKIKVNTEKTAELSDLIKDALVRSSAGLGSGEVLVYTGKIYERITRNEFTQMVEDLICKLDFPSRMANYIVRTWAESWYRILCTRQLEVNHDIVVFPNGVYDLRANLFAAHDRRYVQTYMMVFDYDENSRSTLWEEFLCRVIPDKAYRDTLQMFLGACFVNRQMEGVKFEKMLVLKGRGANGKSVIFDVLQCLFGKDNFTSAKLQDMIQAANLRLNVIDSINGKRLNYASELKFSKRDAANDTLKAIISGEPLQAKKPFGYIYQADRIPLLMANSNDIVGYELLPYSMKRRVLIIPMMVSIPKNEQDVLLAEKLCRDLSSIFNWILTGRKKLMEKEYHIDKEVELQQEVLEKAKDDESVGFWLTTMGYYPCSYNAEAKPQTFGLYELYDSYKEFAQSREFEVKTVKSFSIALKKCGLDKFISGGYVKYRLLDRNQVLAQEYKDKIYRFEKWMISRGQPYMNEAGKSVVKTVAGLAVLFNLQYGCAWRMFHRGVFDGCYYQEGNAFVFEVTKAAAALKSVKQTDTEQIEETRILIVKKQKAERQKFNLQMKRLGLPYRKFAYRKDAGDGKYILVSHDFEYNNKTQMNAYLSMFEDEHDDYNLDQDEEDNK